MHSYRSFHGMPTVAASKRHISNYYAAIMAKFWDAVVKLFYANEHNFYPELQIDKGIPL